MSDVYRAGLGLGMTIMWYMNISESDDELAHILLEMNMESIKYSHIHDDVLDVLFELYGQFQRGILTVYDLDANSDQVINKVPKALHSLLRSRYQAIKSGESVSNLYQCARWGGSRK